MFINVESGREPDESSAQSRTRIAYRGPAHYQHYRNRYRGRCIRNCKDNEATDFLDIFIAAAHCALRQTAKIPRRKEIHLRSACGAGSRGKKKERDT